MSEPISEERALALGASSSQPLVTAGMLVHPDAGRGANVAAARRIFSSYRSTIDPDTRERQDHDLRAFAAYLNDQGALALPRCESHTALQQALQQAAARFADEPEVWAPITWGIVAGFISWQLQEGLAIGTINVRLATVKRYAGLAQQAGVIDVDTLQQIRTVRSISGKQGRALDAQRAPEQRRRGAKKAEAIVLTTTQVRRLIDRPDTPQGRRDRLLVCMLVEHGLRVGELAALTVGCCDSNRGLLRFYREKVHKHQTHKLTADTLTALIRYMQLDRVGAAAEAPLLVGSRKGGALTGTMSIRAIQARVAQLGAEVGHPALSPHDLRHTWAKRATNGRTHPFALRDAGGWSSLDMPNRYVGDSAIANEDVILGTSER